MAGTPAASRGWRCVSVVSEPVGSESAPHFYKSPFAHGFELSQRRKERPVGTWRNSTYDWAPT